MGRKKSWPPASPWRQRKFVTPAVETGIEKGDGKEGGKKPRAPNKGVLPWQWSVGWPWGCQSLGDGRWPGGQQMHVGGQEPPPRSQQTRWGFPGRALPPCPGTHAKSGGCFLKCPTRPRPPARKPCPLGPEGSVQPDSPLSLSGQRPGQFPRASRSSIVALWPRGRRLLCSTVAVAGRPWLSRV